NPQFLVAKITRDSYRVLFAKPAQPNGPIVYFYIQELVGSQLTTRKYPFSTGTATFTINCDSSSEHNRVITLFASNMYNGREYKGPPSDGVQLRFCEEMPGPTTPMTGGSSSSAGTVSGISSTTSDPGGQEDG